MKKSPQSLFNGFVILFLAVMYLLSGCAGQKEDKKPNIIIGVACERDLTSGIQDSYPIPVFGIFNNRPNGPCYDTDVDLELVEKGMIAVLGKQIGYSKEPGPACIEQAGT